MKTGGNGTNIRSARQTPPKQGPSIRKGRITNVQKEINKQIDKFLTKEIKMYLQLQWPSVKTRKHNDTKH